MKLTDQKVKKLIAEVFALIKNSKAVGDLEKIPLQFESLVKNNFNTDRYPEIEFAITAQEVKALIDNKLIDEDLNLSKDISSTITDTVTKLLYATVWKNGDLQKVKHILEGVLHKKDEIDDKEDALVFYQFGKYLTKIAGEPIIDQHVLRAFAIYKSTNDLEIAALRKMSSIDKKRIPLIKEYKEWLTSDELSQDLKKEKDYTNYIDKILFATGKAIKSHTD